MKIKPLFKSILLIDDDDITNYINRRLLKSLEISENLLFAKNGQEGIELLQSFVETNKAFPEVILLDINMPVKDGFGFLEYINKNFSQFKTSIAVLTNSTYKGDLKKIEEAKIKYIINKPLTKENFTSFLEQEFRFLIREKNINNTFSIPIIPANDDERLEAVRKYNIVGTGSEKPFDEIVEEAAKAFEVPFASISIVDEDSVFFKANYGMPAGQYVDRGMSICAVAILQSEVTVFSNAAEDPCLISNPFVHGEFGLRFYAGAPLINNNGYHIGTLCVVDRQPRVFSDEDRKKLAKLANLAMQKIEKRVIISK